MEPREAAAFLRDFAPFEIEDGVILSRDGVAMWEILVSPPVMRVDEALVSLLNEMVLRGTLPG